ncbi:MAG: DUF4190 domain-containing protein [Planctomycetaceae bacterium]|jgi:hypothetical protein|nr:DUF4190 domain-containing protein [Planctomycetaceae bacterium]
MSKIPSDNPYQQPDTYVVPQAMMGSRKDQTLAIISLVTGILSISFNCLCFVSIPCSLVAVITGLLGMQKVSKGTGEGYGMALTGVILGGSTLLTGAAFFGYVFFNAQSIN